MTSAVPGAPLAASAEPGPPGWPGLPADRPLAGARRLVSRVATLCWVELRKIRHDRTELYTRAIQPALWLVIFGETFSRIHAIAVPNGIPYLDFLAPGILAQSTLFIAIFYGIQIIWERDAGVLAKLMVTPTPRAALITGKAFAAGVRSIVQAAVIVVLSAVQRLMPGWLQAISKVNPLSYEVSALRYLLIGVPTNLALDTGVLVGATVAGVTVSSLLLPRLAR